MKVRCIDSSGTHLVLGGIYEVYEEEDKLYKLVDFGHGYYKRRFEIITEKEDDKKIPEFIYLQWFSEDGIDIEEAEEVTWCEDRINDSDLVYKLVKKEE